MNTVLENSPTTIPLPPFYQAGEEIEYPESHDDDMGESSLHYALIAYLWNALRGRFGPRDDVFVAANMNVYYALGRPELYYTPDVMVIFGVGDHERQVYKMWAERVCPQVVFEVASDRTWRNDLREKVKAYGDLGVEEYYALDSENFLPWPLMAYWQVNGRLEELYLDENRVFSPRLGLEIVLTEQGFRLLDAETQEYLPTLTSAQADAQAARLRAEAEAARADTEAARADAEAARANIEAAKTKAEAVRANAAEAQVRQLLDELAKLTGR